MCANRRQFIQGAMGVGAVAAAGRSAHAARGPGTPRQAGEPTANASTDADLPANSKTVPTELPVIVATWDYGRALCAKAQAIFAAGGSRLDALEQGVRVVEDDPHVTSVGYGGLPNEEGVVQLDAAIMDGKTHRAGAVAALERIKNPVSVARKVMEHTRHVMLVGAGALAFARKVGFAEQDLMTPETRRAWEKRKESFWAEPGTAAPGTHDTVCGIALDAAGDLAVAVSTSGLAWKLPGRVGDSPIIGAGLYVDNDVGAATATGMGELAIRTVASFAVVERMRAGIDPGRACEEILERVLAKHPEVRTTPALQLALLALDKRGHAGAAVIRRQKKVFRYALTRGAAAPRLQEVTPLLKS